MKLKRIFLILILAIAYTPLIAQVDSTAIGEVVDAEILINKEREIKLPTFTKKGGKAVGENREFEPLNLTYTAIEPDFEWPAYTSTVEFQRLNEAYPLAIYQNLIGVGYGTFSSPFLEINYHETFNKLKLSTSVLHESFQKGPIGNENSSSSLTSIDVAATSEIGTVELAPELTLKRRGFRYYGNTNRYVSGFSEETSPKATMDQIGFGIKIKGKSGEVNYFGKPTIFGVNHSFVNGQKLNSEVGVGLEGGLSLKIDNTISAGFDLESFSAKYKGGIDYNRTLIQIRPWISSNSSNLLMKAGFSIASEKNIVNSSKTGFYPFFDAELKIKPKWSVTSSIQSGISWKGLDEILSENQFLDDSLSLRNEEERVSIDVGIKGSLTNNLLVKTGITHSNYRSMYFYLPSDDSSRFILGYDDGTINASSIYLDATYTPASSTSIGLKFELIGYATKSLGKAWHVPTKTLNFYLSHNLKERILINTELIAQGGIDAPTNFGAEGIRLKSFIDLNLNINYKVSERVSTFIKMNNLLNNEYEKYVGYPVRGATFKVGGGYRF